MSQVEALVAFFLCLGASFSLSSDFFPFFLFLEQLRSLSEELMGDTCLLSLFLDLCYCVLLLPLLLFALPLLSLPVCAPPVSGSFTPADINSYCI